MSIQGSNEERAGSSVGVSWASALRSPMRAAAAAAANAVDDFRKRRRPGFMIRSDNGTGGDSSQDGYFVSDNGYITFDPAAKASVARNTGLPDASAPAKSIFAFWITFASGRKGVPLKATIGAVAADGKTAILAEGPNFDYPAVGYGGADDLNYKFTPAVK